MSDRALTPLVGATLLLALTVSLAAFVGAALAPSAFAFASTPASTATSASGDVGGPTAALSLSVDGDRLRFVHRGGDALDAERLGVRVSVDGRALAHQPPVPFFAARGYRGGPTGPFNPSADGRWSAGETAALRVAGTNRPALEPGATVAVTLRYDGRPLVTLTAVVR